MLLNYVRDQFPVSSLTLVGAGALAMGIMGILNERTNVDRAFGFFFMMLIGTLLLIFNILINFVTIFV